MAGPTVEQQADLVMIAGTDWWLEMSRVAEGGCGSYAAAANSWILRWNRL
ncbi:hypothetical protein ACFWFQ_26345 [Nocardia salmonicida]